MKLKVERCLKCLKMLSFHEIRILQVQRKKYNYHRLSFWCNKHVSFNKFHEHDVWLLYRKLVCLFLMKCIFYPGHSALVQLYIQHCEENGQLLQDVFVKKECPWWQQSSEWLYFSLSQCYTDIDLGLILKTKRKRSDSVLWLKPLHQQKCQKGKVTTPTEPQKFDYTAIADRLRTVSWSNYSHQTGVVNRFTGPTFSLPATAVYSKGHTFQNL